MDNKILMVKIKVVVVVVDFKVEVVEDFKVEVVEEEEDIKVEVVEEDFKVIKKIYQINKIFYYIFIVLKSRWKRRRR